MQIRAFDLSSVQFRQTDDEMLSFTGHAAMFGKLSDDLGGFREKVDKGAFKRTIGRDNDVRFLINHDPNLVLARSKAKTLRMKEDDKGLAVEAEMAPTSYAKDLSILLQRGDVDQMSFGFFTIKDEWDESTNPPTRTLKEVKLLDVSVVTYPAYPQTDAALRELDEMVKFLADLEPHHFEEAYAELRSGPLTEDHLSIVRAAHDKLGTLLQKGSPGRRMSLVEAQHRLRSLEVQLKYELL